LDTFEYHEIKCNERITLKTLVDHVTYVSLYDTDPETFEENVENIIELFEPGKRVYISCDFSNDKLKHLEQRCGKSTSRKEDQNKNIIINSVKTTEKMFLEHSYDIFIFSFHDIKDPLKLVCYLKDTLGNKPVDIYIDTDLHSFHSNLKELCSPETIPRYTIKDSQEYNTYQDLIKDTQFEPIIITEYYCKLQLEGKYNLSSLSKKDYESIRYFIKTKLITKFDMDIKTCQLSYPCSPKDRSKKLNSLSNKISSYDYRCNVTCEVFKDFSVGVIVWNDFFSDRTELALHELKNKNYIYQTTSGTWKFTTIV